MLFRFSLYGFLKNQRYFEPFLALIFYGKLESWFLVGLLIGFREVMVNVMEVPSGAIADLYGRRTSMILSFASYIVSFIVFGFAAGLPALLIGMVFFAIGEAFRTGTHKSMIFTWLKTEGRSGERTRVYGYTRSWSKFGSAVSVILAGGIVLFLKDYNYLFHISAAIYVLGIVNFLGYPAKLEGARVKESVRVVEIIAHLRRVLSEMLKKRSLRRLLFESMGFESVFASGKDYVQPILLSAALPLTAAFALTQGLADAQKGVVLIIPVYVLIYVLSGIASRNAHRLVPGPGAEARAAWKLWGSFLVVFALLGLAAYFGLTWLLVLSFVCLHAFQNLWRPIFLARLDTAGRESQSATILSVESQARSAATMVLAPLLGLAVTLVQRSGMGASEFWPVGALGAAFALLFFLTGARKR